MTQKLILEQVYPEKEIDNECFYMISNVTDTSSEHFKDFLKRIIELDEKIKIRLLCSCHSDNQNKVQFSIKHNKKNYYISHYPNQSHLHSRGCMFYNDDKILDYKTNENNEISMISEFLMDEPSEYIKHIKAKTTINQESDILIRGTKSFNGILLAIVSTVYAFSFNQKNKGIDRLDGHLMKNIEDAHFLRTFNYILKNVKTYKGKSKKPLLDYLAEKGLIIEYGFSYDKLPQAENPGRLISMEYSSKNYTITNSTLHTLYKNLIIYKNIIAPPYFYFFLVKGNKILRGFVYPFCIVNDQNINYISPVESNLERLVIANLLNNSKCIYKPIVTNSISQILTNKHGLSSKFFQANLNNYRPDAFIFQNTKIKIIEISGEMSKEYNKQLLEKEERFYNKLDKDIFEYERLTANKQN